MAREDVLFQLKNDLGVAQKKVEEWSAEVRRLSGAIDALEDRAPAPAPSAARAPRATGSMTVVAMIYEAAQEMPEGYSFAKTKVAAAATAKHPEFADKIKGGMHPAFNQLLRSGKIKVAPGGFLVV